MPTSLARWFAPAASRRLLLAALLGLVGGAAAPAMAQSASAQPPQLRILAAEPVYAAIAARIAGDRAQVASLITNPATDPHEFEPSAAAARSLADADIVILNGAGYDGWADRILAASPKPGRQTIVLANLMRRTPGDNPHLWFSPRAAPALATALAIALGSAQPQDMPLFLARRDALMANMQPLLTRIGQMRERYLGVPVTSDEGVFNEMAAAIGLRVVHTRLQTAIAAELEPAPEDVAALEASLTGGRVRVLILNPQNGGGISPRLRELAAVGHVPVIEVGETQPAGLPAGQEYETWLMALLDQLDRALASGPAQAKPLPALPLPSGAAGMPLGAAPSP